MTRPATRPRRADRPPPPPETCVARAVDALARRAYARVELGRYLVRKGFTEEVVAAALERLAERGYLDDLAYARGFAHSRMTGRAYGPRRVRTELARRGVAPAVVSQVLAEREHDAVEDAGGVLGAARRRLNAMRGLAPDVARRRLVGWLVRRGFGMGESMRATRTLLDASAADDAGCVDPAD